MVTGIKPQLVRCFEINPFDESPSEFRRSALMKGAFTVQMGQAAGPTHALPPGAGYLDSVSHASRE